jgi:hypothetical protein
VSTAASLGRELNVQPLGGTITYIDSLGGDETQFVDAVVHRFGIRNERFDDPSPWCDDGELPPLTPEPARDYPFYARDRRTAEVLKEAGATTLLSGVGPDCYMQFGASHIPDLVLSGAIREGAQQLFQWAYVRRQSIWKVLGRGLDPIRWTSSERRIRCSSRDVNVSGRAREVSGEQDGRFRPPPCPERLRRRYLYHSATPPWLEHAPLWLLANE